MRKLAIIFGILVVAGMLILNNQDTERTATLQQDSIAPIENAVVESDIAEPVIEPNPSLIVVEPVVETPRVWVVDEQKLLAHQEELKILIQEYDRHLSDRDKRAEIEQKMALVAESYKQEVLAKFKGLQ